MIYVVMKTEPSLLTGHAADRCQWSMLQLRVFLLERKEMRDQALHDSVGCKPKHELENSASKFCV